MKQNSQASPIKSARKRRRLRRLAHKVPARQGLRNFTQTELHITESMSQLMAELMGLVEPEGAVERSYYLPLNGLGKRQRAELLGNTDAVRERGLPHFLDIAELDGIGYGVFLRSDERSISRGTMLGIYMGQLRLITDEDYNSRTGPMITYEYDLDGPLELSEKQFHALQRDGYIAKEVRWFQDEQYWLTVDAYSQGNWTRLVNGTTKSAANVEAEIRKLKFGDQLFFAPVLMARCQIKPGEQLLLDYGSQYWETLGTRPRPVHPDTWMVQSEPR